MGKVKEAIKEFNAGIRHSDWIVTCEETNYEELLVELEELLDEYDSDSPRKSVALQNCMIRTHSSQN